jgi:hypothetical protein
MRVEWRAADGEQNQQQPVNSAVLIAVADAIAERARAAALDANRRGQFDDARRILQGVVDQLRTLAPGIPQIETIIDRLRGDQERFAMPLGALATKAIYFNTYSSSRSRAPSGSARRRSKKDDEPE